MQGEKELEVENRTVGRSSAARSKFRRVCSCVAVPLTLIVIFGVVTFISLWYDFPKARPVQLHLDASQDSRYVRAVFEVEIDYKWGAFHTYRMNEAECQIRVACNDSDPCVALTSRLTGVNHKGDRLSYDFQFNDVSPRNLMRVMSGSHGTTLRCDIEPSIDVWNTGMVMTRAWTYETTSLLGASPLTLVRTAHRETMPTRDNLTASLDANYTLHWALPEGMIANFLKSTPVTIKADAGVVESSKRAAMGFVGVDDRVVVKALPDGGVEATLPLMTTSSINIAATTGVLGTAAFNFTDSIDALNNGGVPPKEAEVFFHIHGKAVQDLLGKEHRVAVHSTHVRLDSPANSGGRRLNPQDSPNPPPPMHEPWRPLHHRPHDVDFNAFFQTHRLKVDDEHVVGIDIAIVDGTSANGQSAPFEVQVDVFQIFTIDENKDWNAKAALVVDGDRVDAGFTFAEHAEEKMKGLFHANFDTGDLRLNIMNDQGLIFEAHHEADAKRLRVVFEDGENLEFATRATWGDDEPGYHLSLTSPDLTVTSDLDAQRERLRVDVESPDLEMSYRVDHQAKRMELRLDSEDIDVSFNVDSYDSGLDSQGRIEFCEESASETSSGRCPCIGLPPSTERVSCTSNYWNGLDPWWSTGECVLGSRHVHDRNAIYPGDYGATCKKHYEPSSYDCFDVDAGEERPTIQRGQRADWCGRSWCYVDANNCHGADYYESSYFRGSGLYYSYRECWSDQSACPCSGLPSSIDRVPCSAEGEDKPWYLHSDSAEDCVRVPELRGEPLYPGDYGDTCKEHREPGHPDCWDVTTNSELPHHVARSEHCDRSWCFVDPNNCRNREVSETWDFHDEVGVLHRVYDWESDECPCSGGLPGSVVRVACSEDGQDTPWYLEGAGNCVMKHGRRIRGDYGARMEKQYKAWDGSCFYHGGDHDMQELPHREPERAEDCDRAWCWVDRENCEGVDVRESHDFPGETRYYSFGACEPEEHSGINQPRDRPGLHRQESDGTSCGVTSVNFGAEWSFLPSIAWGDDWENVPQKYASDHKGWYLGLNNGTGDNEQELVITYTAPVTISLLAFANGNDNVAPEETCANNEDCCATHEDCTFTDCSREGWSSPGCAAGQCYQGREDPACDGAENGFQLDRIDGRPSWCWDGIASMRCSPEPAVNYGPGIDGFETIAAANGWEQESEWTQVRYESGVRKEISKIKTYVQKFTTGSSVSMPLPGSGTNPVHLGVVWNGKHCQAKGPVQSTTTTPQETTTTRSAEQGNCTEGKSLRRFEIRTEGNFGDADNNGQWSAQVTTQDPMYQDVSRIDLTWTREGARDPNMDRFSLALAFQEERSREESERTPSNGTYHAAMDYSVEIVVRTAENAEAKSTVVMVDLGAHPTCSQPGGAMDNERCSWLREEDGDSWSEDMTCCRYSLPHGVNLFNFDEREELVNNEVRVVEFLQEDHVRVEAYLDRSKDLPRLEADYTFVGDVHRIEGFVNVSATEALASGNIQWRTSDDMFESSAIIWDGEMSELVAGDLSWHERPQDFHVVTGSLAIDGEPLGSGQIVVDDSRPHFKAFSERVLNGDGEELSFGGISWSEHAHEQTVAGNLSMDGDLLGTATFIVDDHPNKKDLWASVTGGENGTEPLLDMTFKLEPGDDLFSFTADFATNLTFDPKLSIVVGGTTLDPQPAIDFEIRHGENFESLVLAGHAHCTHPGRLLETGDNRQVLLAEPFLASGWVDNMKEEESTREDVRARLGAFDWVATDAYGNFSSRLRVTGADDDTEMLLWTLSIGEHPRDVAQDLMAQNGTRRLTGSDDVMVILSRLAIEEDEKLRLRGVLEQDTGLMEGEIEALVDGESHSIWCEASQGFLEMMDRPTGFDRFHVALGSVIEGNQANVSVYIERGPDVQVSGLGYRVGLYDGAGENKTALYEGSGDIDLEPGRAPRRPEVQSEAAVRVDMEMEGDDLSLFNRRSFEDLMVQAARDNGQQVSEADVIVESIWAEVRTMYTVDREIQPENLQTAVANMHNVRREDVAVSRNQPYLQYRVIVTMKDLRRATQIVEALGHTRPLAAALEREVRAEAPFQIQLEQRPEALVAVRTAILSEAEVAPLPPPLHVVADAAAAIVGDQITIRSVGVIRAPGALPPPTTTTEPSLECAPLQLGRGVDVSACEGKMHTETCRVRCAEGYRGTQPQTYTCRNTGVFDGIPMACARVMCPVSSLPVGRGRVFSECSERYEGETCTASCAPGFEPATATATLTCSGDGEFEFAGDPLQCEPAACEVGALDGDVSVEHNCDGVTHNQMCLARCADGYSGSPPFVVNRCNEGALAGGKPSCEARECRRDLPRGRGIDSDCQGKETEQTCNAVCVDGFEPDPSACANDEFTCRPDGAFASSCASGEYACVRSQCQDLAAVAGFGAAGVETTCASKSYRESCLAYCAPGYTGAVRPVRCTLGSPSTAGFEQLGGGAASAPACAARECVFNLPNIRGVQHTCAGKTTGQTCEVTAADGFEYVGSSSAVTLTCGPDRAFTGDPLPDVQPQTCSLPALLSESQFGTTCGASTPVGERCYAYCLAGTSVTTYTCQMNSGTATLEPTGGVQVSCARRLSSAEANRTATQRRLSECDSSISSTSGLSGDGVLNDCQGIAVNDPCISYCGNGYSEDAGPFRYTCESGGALSGTGISVCTALQCTYGVPTGVGVAHDCDSAATGASCTASCDAGYQYATGSGAQTFTCQATGELSGTSPVCEPAECAAPTLAQEFRSTCAGKVTGEECLVDCADGWQLDSDPAVWTCGTDGQVNGTEPTCTAQTCSAVGLPAGAAFDVPAGCSSLTTGQTCSISCAAGYSGSAETFICDPSGTITGSAPVCAEQTCPVPAAVAGVAFVDCDNVATGETCVASCADGYQFANGGAPEVWTCEMDGSQTLALTGSAPQCEALPCNDGLPVGDAFTHDCSGLVTGQTCSCSCAAGYVPAQQQQELQCLASGSGWLSGSCPPCESARCDSQSRTLPNVVNGCDGVAQGGECFATCAPGYDGEDQRWTCELQDDGTVSLQGEAPSCTQGITTTWTYTSTAAAETTASELPGGMTSSSMAQTAARPMWLCLIAAGAMRNMRNA